MGRLDRLAVSGFAADPEVVARVVRVQAAKDVADGVVVEVLLQSLANLQHSRLAAAGGVGLADVPDVHERAEATLNHVASLLDVALQLRRGVLVDVVGRVALAIVDRRREQQDATRLGAGEHGLEQVGAVLDFHVLDDLVADDDIPALGALLQQLLVTLNEVELAEELQALIVGRLELVQVDAGVVVDMGRSTASQNFAKGFIFSAANFKDVGLCVDETARKAPTEEVSRVVSVQSPAVAGFAKLRCIEIPVVPVLFTFCHFVLLGIKGLQSKTETPL